MSCTEGLTVAEFCAKKPTTAGCKTSSNSSTSSTSQAPIADGTRPVTTAKPTIACCKALTADCLACAAGLSPADFCKKEAKEATTNATTVGCKISYQCTTEDPVKFSPLKAAWCCKEQKVGCKALEAFDCRTREVWSFAKKKWCCAVKKLGCDDNIDCFNHTVAMSKQEFCCDKKGIGCPVKKCAAVRGWTGAAPTNGSNCGRGGKPCDAGSKCDIAPNDAFAVCCPVKTTTDDGKPICCEAMTANCLACKAGKSVRDYCVMKLASDGGGSIATVPECKETWYKLAGEAASKAIEVCLAGKTYAQAADKAAFDKTYMACKAGALYAECIALNGSEADCKAKETAVKDKTNVKDSTKIDETLRDDAVAKMKAKIEACLTAGAKTPAECRKEGDDEYLTNSGDAAATPTDLTKKREEAGKDAFLDSINACMATAVDDASKATCKCDAYKAHDLARGVASTKTCDEAVADTAETLRDAKVGTVLNTMTSCMRTAGTDANKHKACIEEAKAAKCAVDASCGTVADDKKDAVTKTNEDTDFKKDLEKAADKELQRFMRICLEDNLKGVKTAADKDALYAKCKAAGKGKFASARGKGDAEVTDTKVNEAIDRSETSEVRDTMHACVLRIKEGKAAGAKVDQVDYDACKEEAKTALGGLQGTTGAEVDTTDLTKKIHEGAVSDLADFAKDCTVRAKGNAAKLVQCNKDKKEKFAESAGITVDAINDGDFAKAEDDAAILTIKDTVRACIDGKTGSDDQARLCKDKAMDEYAKVKGIAKDTIDKTDFEGKREQATTDAVREHMKNCGVGKTTKADKKKCSDKLPEIIATSKGEATSRVSLSDALKELEKAAKKAAKVCMDNCVNKKVTDAAEKKTMYAKCDTKCFGDYTRCKGKVAAVKGSDDERDELLDYDEAKEEGARATLTESLKNCKDADRKVCIAKAQADRKETYGDDKSSTDQAKELAHMCKDEFKATYSTCLNAGKALEECQAEGFGAAAALKVCKKATDLTKAEKETKSNDCAGDEARDKVKACIEAADKTAVECQTLGKAVFKKFGGKADRYNNKIEKEATKDAATWISRCLAKADTTEAKAKCEVAARKKIEDVAGEKLDDKKYEEKKKVGGAGVAVDTLAACLKEAKEDGAANLEAAKKACDVDAKADYEKCGGKKHEAQREMLAALLEKAASILVACQDADATATLDTCKAEAKAAFTGQNGKIADWLRHVKRVLKKAQWEKAGTPTERTPKDTVVVDTDLQVEGGAAVFCDKVAGKDARDKVKKAFAKYAKVTEDKVKMVTCGDKALVVEEGETTTPTRRRRLLGYEGETDRAVNGHEAWLHATRHLRASRRLAASSCSTGMEVQGSSTDDAATIADAMGVSGTAGLNTALAASGVTATGTVAASRDFTEAPVSSASVSVDPAGPSNQPTAVKTDGAANAAPSMLLAVACVVAALLR